MADGVAVECADTGADTPTGGRIKLVEERLDGEPFCATYADGVADIDLALLLGAHKVRRRWDRDGGAPDAPVRRRRAG